MDLGQPSNVSASGMITTLSGRPVNGARIVLSAAGVESRIGRTNPFGYFTVDDVVVGQTYQVTVQAKGLTFLPRSVTVGGEISGFDHFSVNDH